MSIADQLRASVLEWAVGVAEQATENMIFATQLAAPFDTGALRQSIDADPWAVDPSGSLTTTFRAAVDYASYTDTGTGVYAGNGRIYPIRAKALRFFWKNGPRGADVYYFASVAGIPPQRWWADPLPDRWHAAVALALS